MLPAILESRLKILEALAEILDFRGERACLGRQAGVYFIRRAEDEPVWPISNPGYDRPCIAYRGLVAFSHKEKLGWSRDRLCIVIVSCES